MERTIYLNELYDCYKELFTDKQRLYFEEYYWDNLSLSEMADNNDVSRNAIHNQLKIMENRLEELESQLLLNHKRKEIETYFKSRLDEKLFLQLMKML